MVKLVRSGLVFSLFVMLLWWEARKAWKEKWSDEVFRAQWDIYHLVNKGVRGLPSMERWVERFMLEYPYIEPEVVRMWLTHAFKSGVEYGVEYGDVFDKDPRTRIIKPKRPRDD